MVCVIQILLLHFFFLSNQELYLVSFRSLVDYNKGGFIEMMCDIVVKQLDDGAMHCVKGKLDQVGDEKKKKRKVQVKERKANRCFDVFA